MRPSAAKDRPARLSRLPEKGRSVLRGDGPKCVLLLPDDHLQGNPLLAATTHPADERELECPCEFRRWQPAEHAMITIERCAWRKRTGDVARFQITGEGPAALRPEPGIERDLDALASTRADLGRARAGELQGPRSLVEAFAVPYEGCCNRNRTYGGRASRLERAGE